MTKQYVWGLYIDELLQINLADSSKYYPLQDLLYRTNALTDSNGSITEKYDTDAYGKTLLFNAADETITNPTCEFIFTGRRFDPESELYFYRARYYNPELGRFISRDPLSYWDSMNMYEYVGSRATTGVDPMGLQDPRMPGFMGGSNPAPAPLPRDISILVRKQAAPSDPRNGTTDPCDDAPNTPTNPPKTPNTNPPKPDEKEQMVDLTVRRNGWFYAHSITQASDGGGGLYNYELMPRSGWLGNVMGTETIEWYGPNNTTNLPSNYNRVIYRAQISRATAKKYFEKHKSEDNTSYPYITGLADCTEYADGHFIGLLQADGQWIKAAIIQQLMQGNPLHLISSGN